MVAAGLAGGALREQVISGLSDAGALTRWGLPVSRFAMEAGGTLTVGVLLGAVVLLPSTRGVLDPQAIRYLRGASWIAAVWAAGAAATLIFTVSDILGIPADKVVGGNELSSYVGQLPQGTALMFVVLLAALIALLARTAATPGQRRGPARRRAHRPAPAAAHRALRRLAQPRAGHQRPRDAHHRPRPLGGRPRAARLARRARRRPPRRGGRAVQPDGALVLHRGRRQRRRQRDLPAARPVAAATPPTTDGWSWSS